MTREQRRARMSSGFSSLRELMSYTLGTGVLIYGVIGASADKAFLVVGAGLALVGAPIVGSLFEKKTGD